MLLTKLRDILHGYSKLDLGARVMSTTNVNAAAKLKPTKPPNLLRKKLLSVVPGSVNLQILGCGANGAPSTVYLFTDQSRYLFNCGEGTQRLAHEHKTRLARLEQIFLTRNTWPTVGGLPGLSLTIQDAGVRELGLHGPPYLDTMLQSMRRFVVLNYLKMKCIDSTQQTFFEDSVLSVSAVPLFSTDKFNENEQQRKVAISYICKLKPRPGALLLEKCVEYGVPPGPLLGQLKKGNDITLPNGKLVRSADVTEPAETALCFIFIDVPSKDYLPALQQQANTFKALGSEVAVVLHFSESAMLENNCYQAFMAANFVNETQHIYLNSPKNNLSGYVSAQRLQYQLNQLHPQVFPLLHESLELQRNLSMSISNNLKKTKLLEEETEKQPGTHALNEHEVDAEGLSAMTSFHLRPKKGFDRTMEAKLMPAEYIQETHAVPGFPALLQQLKHDYKALPKPTETLPAYPKLTFLGTGSCIPNKTRNVSSILLQTREDGYMLFDCGEGTYGQIVRLFGATQAAEIMKHLRVIYISHLHADHHIGLIGLLNARQQLQLEDKVLLLAPQQIESWLEFYDKNIESIGESYTLIGNAKLLQQPYTSMEAGNFGISKISTCFVRHCPHSFGVRVTLSGEQYAGVPISVTYSGDTMPCQDLVELGRNTTILIHEATMENDLIEEAKAKTHSTIAQAIEQGRNMKAGHTILTHFSQRYAKCPRLDLEGDDGMKNVAIAFDNMQITLAELQHFYLMYPTLFAMFAEYTEELEQRALKRELKQERKRKLIEST